MSDNNVFQSENNIYLNVPFSEKEECKQLGAWWHSDRKLWFINEWTQKYKPENTHIMVERWGE